MSIQSSSSTTESESESALDVVLALYEAIDTGHATEGASLFADDAVFDHPEKVFRGIEEIRGFLSARESDADRHTIHVLGLGHACGCKQVYKSLGSAHGAFQAVRSCSMHAHRCQNLQ